MSVDHVDTQSVIILFHVQCGPRRSQVVSGAGYRVMHPEKAGGLWAPLLMLYAEGTLGGTPSPWHRVNPWYQACTH